jgi:hypothetical protein
VPSNYPSFIKSALKDLSRTLSASVHGEHQLKWFADSTYILPCTGKSLYKQQVFPEALGLGDQERYGRIGV